MEQEYNWEMIPNHHKPIEIPKELILAGYGEYDMFSISKDSLDENRLKLFYIGHSLEEI